MTPRYRVEYLPEAQQELVDIYDMITDYAGAKIAGKKLAKIEKVTKSLADMPYRGSIRNDLTEGLRAIPAGQKAVVCFTIQEEKRTVRIIAISYAGSDWVSQVIKRISR